MKIVVLGDIHGRDCWKSILAEEDYDKVVFLGDYVSTHEGISENTQINNLQEIIDFKKNNLDKVILLRGNHDMQHLGYSWAECSGLQRNVQQFMMENKDEFLKYTQWIYINEDIVFSHAGISQVWLDNCGIKLEDINSMELSELFGFTPNSIMDTYGNSVTQPPTWIRPGTLAACNIKGYTQIVGHTPVRYIADIYKSCKYNEHIWLCDNLPTEYVVVVDGEVSSKKNLNLIKLPNREGSLYLSKQDGYYSLLSNKPYITNYIRVIKDKQGNIEAVDPSGGPFMSLGYTVGNLVLKRISSDSGIKLYFEENDNS